jgi:hypothetical protein
MSKKLYWYQFIFTSGAEIFTVLEGFKDKKINYAETQIAKAHIKTASRKLMMVGSFYIGHMTEEHFIINYSK